MKLRAITLSLALCAAPAFSEAPAQPSVAVAGISDEALALAREIIAKGFPVESRRAMFDGVMANMMQQMRSAQGPMSEDPGVDAILDRHLGRMRARMLLVTDKHSDAMFDAFAVAYARNFPIEELRVIRDFASTTAGQHYISRSSSLLSDPAVAAANQAYMSDVMAVIPEVQKPLVDELKAYHAKHP
jgi:hypothetical protein